MSPNDVERASSVDVLGMTGLMEVCVLEIVFGVLADGRCHRLLGCCRGATVVVNSGACACPVPATSQAVARRSPAGYVEPMARLDRHGRRHRAELTCPGDGTVHAVLRHAQRRAHRRPRARRHGRGDLASAIAVIIGAWEADLHLRLRLSIASPAPPAAAPPPPKRSSPTATHRQPPAAPAEPLPRLLRLGLRFGVVLLVALRNSWPAARPWAGPSRPPVRATWELRAPSPPPSTSRDSSVGSLSRRRPVVAGDAGWSPMRGSTSPPPASTCRPRGSPRSSPPSEGAASPRRRPRRSSPQLGGAAALRTAWAWGRPRSGWERRFSVFPGDDRLVVTGLAAQGHLPHIELQLASGLSLGRFP